jgi:tetratricopeptide (TPR) repeat protein
MQLRSGKSERKSGRRIVIDLQKAERGLKEGRQKDVETLCTEVLDERPGHVHALQILAELRIKQKRLDDAMTFIEQASAGEPDSPRTLNLLGRVLNNRDRLAEAEVAFRKAAEGDPEYADAHANLGHVLRRTGRLAEAENAFRHAIRHDREHGLANLSLGAMLYERGLPEQAVPHLQAGLKRELTNRTGQYNLATALHELGRMDEAITAYRRLVAAGDDDPAVYSNLAAALQATGDPELATAGFESALELNPNFGPAAAGLAGILETSGRAEQALALLAPFVRGGDETPSVHVAWAHVLKTLERRNEALVHLAEMIKKPGRPDDTIAAHYVVGEILDEMGEHDRAFAHVRHANRLRHGRYVPAQRERDVERLMATFTRESLAAMPHGSQSDAPVFIVGMPRSGTSLVEQIIATHPRGAGAGELPHVALSAQRIGRYNKSGVPYPECVSLLRERDLKELSSAYLARLFQESERARRITDKMWHNFEHLGFIEMMFANAWVIHCRRNPLDSGLSCYFQSFGTAPPPFASDLGHIGHYYGQYRRLMDHWHEVSGLKILDLDYEALVADQEGESRRIIEFLGLAWDPAVLSFHENPRPVRTASHAQVKRPIYTTSIGRARHYEAHLGPLKEALAAAGYPAESPAAS